MKAAPNLSVVYEVALKTELQLAQKLTAELGNAVYLKREDLQPVHSFKLRGAYYKISRLSAAEKRRGIIAASAGNHAQGVALSAQKLGLTATIVMPRTTPAIKVDAVRSYGADIVLSGDSYSDAYQTCLQLIEQTGKTLVHPFDDLDVIAGQGTIGSEILEQLPEVGYVFVPIGGGGLAAGVGQAIKQVRPDVKIIGVEPEDSNAMQASLTAGKRVILPHVGVFADGVAVKQVGEQTFRLCQRYIDEVITVSNDQICAAIKHIYEQTRGIVEPAGALGLAGLQVYAQREALRDANCVAICSGANMSFERLQFVAERTLLGSGKESIFAVALPEMPGALHKLCIEVLEGHNITEFGYRLQSRRAAKIFLGINTASVADKTSCLRKLTAHGYTYQDLSTDDVVKEHIRHMVGGPAPAAVNERVYEISFPERPGALADFLAAVGDSYNISLFHYRGQGGDEGKVLIGFEAASKSSLEHALKNSGYGFQSVQSAALKSFL